MPARFYNFGVIFQVEVRSGEQSERTSNVCWHLQSLDKRPSHTKLNCQVRGVLISDSCPGGWSHRIPCTMHFTIILF